MNAGNSDVTNTTCNFCEGCPCKTGTGMPPKPTESRTQWVSMAIGKAVGGIILALMGGLVISLGVAVLVGLWRVIL